MSPVFILWFALGGGTLYNGPYGDALPKRTSRLQDFQVYETVGISLSIWKGREICNFGLSKGSECLIEGLRLWKATNSIRFHKWQCITARLKACKILNYTVPSCQFFFFFFWCKQLDPGTEPPLQNLFECLPPDQYKPIMSLKHSWCLVSGVIVDYITNLCHLKAFLLNWTVIVYRRRRWILVQRLGVLKTCIL